MSVADVACVTAVPAGGFAGAFAAIRTSLAGGAFAGAPMLLAGLVGLMIGWQGAPSVPRLPGWTR